MCWSRGWLPSCLLLWVPIKRISLSTHPMSWKLVTAVILSTAYTASKIKNRHFTKSCLLGERSTWAIPCPLSRENGNIPDTIRLLTFSLDIAGFWISLWLFSHFLVHFLLLGNTPYLTLCDYQIQLPFCHQDSRLMWYSSENQIDESSGE